MDELIKYIAVVNNKTDMVKIIKTTINKFFTKFLCEITFSVSCTDVIKLFSDF